jgi:hypothetical protein
MAFTFTRFPSTVADVESDGSIGQIRYIEFEARKEVDGIVGGMASSVAVPLGYGPAQIPYTSVTEADLEAWTRSLYPESEIEAYIDSRIALQTHVEYRGLPTDAQAEFPVWVNNHPYSVEDVVSYGTGSVPASTDSLLYECIQAHTSQNIWTPPATPALWKIYIPSGVIAQWVQPTGAQDAYDIGDQVWWDYNSQGIHLWESNTAANVWEPGVFGWDDLGPYTP